MNKKAAKAAILIYNAGQQALAETVQKALPKSEIFSFQGRGSAHNIAFTNSQTLIKDLFEAERPIIGLTAAGILIRLIAPLLHQKRTEPPVLVLSVDGKSIVPLIGALSGADILAETLAHHLGGQAVITSMSPVQLGLWLEKPPQGWVLTNPEQAKYATRRLSEGAKLLIHGTAPWLEDTKTANKATSKDQVSITISDQIFNADQTYDLHYVPQTLLVVFKQNEGLKDYQTWQDENHYHPLAKAMTAICYKEPNNTADHDDKPLIKTSWPSVKRRVLYCGLTCLIDTKTMAIFKNDQPIHNHTLKLNTADITVVGLGPGAKEWLTPEARTALINADIWIGYTTYLNQAERMLHELGETTTAQHFASGNRVEIDRSHHAINLAKSGQKVAVISSGDPGIFAMSAALLEAYETLAPHERDLDLHFIPGLSAFQAAAARLGAPFGHDFALVSLSDNLKPWSIIEKRLGAMLEHDIVIALYNPASKNRQQAINNLDNLLKNLNETPRLMMIAKNIGREHESIHHTTTSDFDISSVDMNTLIIIGSKQTRVFDDNFDNKLVYSPRTYNETTLK